MSLGGSAVATLARKGGVGTLRCSHTEKRKPDDEGQGSEGKTTKRKCLKGKSKTKYIIWGRFGGRGGDTESWLHDWVGNVE